MRISSLHWVAVLALAAALGCSNGPVGPGTKGITPERHTWFPITAGSSHELGRAALDGPITCESCHASTNSDFKQFSCTACHEHPQDVTDRLHLAVTAYEYGPQTCLTCHSSGERIAFTHSGITSMCASCHDVGTLFAALPKTGFTHPDMRGSDCASCHVTTTWQGASDAPLDAHDPANDISLDGLVPVWSGTTMAALNVNSQVLQMRMNHATPSSPLRR
ncbi:MAG: hypothetical protein IPJ65_20095 [Archangiaceae bacterium]|nr:hypothetical protein [Archangiaceae bacterium]